MLKYRQPKKFVPAKVVSNYLKRNRGYLVLVKHNDKKSPVEEQVEAPVQKVEEQVEAPVQKVEHHIEAPVQKVEHHIEAPVQQNKFKKHKTHFLNSVKALENLKIA
jgi:hypothetical protein